jgi:ribosomal protein L11 methyltransferase
VAGGHALPRARTGRRVLHVEAGEAFGSGHHGTTRGCLLLLEHLSRRWPPARRRQGRALDVGTGSGVLAIAAAQAGFGHAEAYDIDPRAVAVTRENVSLNRVRGRVRAVGVSPGVRRMRQRAARFDLVFANILMRPLVRLAPDLAAAVAPGGRLVVSGLLAEQRPRIRAAYLGQGLVLERATRLDGWASMMFRRPA